MSKKDLKDKKEEKVESKAEVVAETTGTSGNVVAVEPALTYNQWILDMGHILYEADSPLLAGFRVWIAVRQQQSLGVIRLTSKNWQAAVEEYKVAPTK